ncbi:MAG: PhzF family phenazine biosynthesis protein [Gammaproteobacteria bacterium]
MPKLTIYQVDTFTNTIFGGNPAAVCPLQTWLSTDIMQAIATENNLSETAFFVPQSTDNHFAIRWFTPNGEVKLCGHATLATAFVIYEQLQLTQAPLCFNSASGLLHVTKHQQGIQLNFPAINNQAIDITIANKLGLMAEQCFQSAQDYLIVLPSQKQLVAYKPNLITMMTLDLRGVIITAPGNDCDVVSRCFYPKLHVPEDPVTGSAHCQIIPYWAERLQKNSIIAKQLSARDGTLQCEYKNNRVYLAGNAALYMQGTLYLPD